MCCCCWWQDPRPVAHFCPRVATSTPYRYSRLAVSTQQQLNLQAGLDMTMPIPTRTTAEDWEPALEVQPQAIDFRGIKTQPKGYKERNKRKLDDDYAAHEAQTQEAGPSSMEVDEGQAGKRRKAEGTAYIPVSGHRMLMHWKLRLVASLRRHAAARLCAYAACNGGANPPPPFTTAAVGVPFGTSTQCGMKMVESHQ